MKKSCKKIVAAILAACMLFSFATVASAQEESPADYAQELLSSAMYKYWVEDSVLPSDVILDAFDNNSLFYLYWGGLFTGDNAFLEDIQKFYAMNLVDVLSLAQYTAPTYEQSDIDSFITAFGNSVIDYLGYPGTEEKVGDINAAMVQVYDKYQISERARAAINPESLCPEVAELTAYLMVLRDYVDDLKDDINYLYFHTNGDGNLQAAFGIVDGAIDIAYQMAEEYIYANEATDVADALYSGFVVNLGVAFVEYLTVNEIATGDVNYDNALTLCQNFVSTVDECAKYFISMKFAINNYEPVFEAAIDESAEQMGAATGEAAIDAAAADVISRYGLYMGLVNYQAVLSASFATAAEGLSQQYYQFICEFLNNIEVADADLAAEIADETLSTKWSVIALGVALAANLSTTDMTAADFADLLVPAVPVASAKASFAGLGLASDATIHITTADYKVAYMSGQLAEDNTFEISRLIPGTYAWMANNDYGTVTIGANGVATVEYLGKFVDPPSSSDIDSSSQTSEVSSSTETDDTNNTDGLPKTGDNTAVFFATLICLAAAAAYVFTKRVRD